MTKYKNKEEISKNFRDNLQLLKPHLPHGYHPKIKEAIPDLTSNQIMNAFNGRPVDVDILIKIVQKAIDLANERQSAVERVNEELHMFLEKLKSH